MTIATIGAFAIGEYVDATAVMLLYQLGELFQRYAVGKSRKNIAAPYSTPSRLRQPDITLSLAEALRGMLSPVIAEVSILLSP